MTPEVSDYSLVPFQVNPRGPEQNARLHWTVASVVVALSAAYIGSCLVLLRDFAKNLRLINAAPYTSIVVPHVRAEVSATVVNALLLLAMLLTMIIWLAALRRRLDRIGHVRP